MNAYNRHFQPWNARSNSRTDTAYQSFRQGENSRSPMGMRRVTPSGADRVECNNHWWKNVGLGRKPTTCS